MNTIIKWAIKSYAKGFVNNILAARKESVDNALKLVDKGIAKAEKVIAYLKSVAAKLADGIVDDDEADEIVDESVTLAKEITE